MSNATYYQGDLLFLDLQINLFKNMAYHEFHVKLTITTKKTWLNSLGERGQAHKKNVIKLDL